MIRNVMLEIDWADELWAHFPLVARALGELKALRRLELVFVERGPMTEIRTMGIDRDVNLDIRLMYDQHSLSEKGRHQCRHATAERADWRGKREGARADAMLKAERKMLEDLVGGIKGLRWFRLIGYRDPIFSERLEECVRVGKHRCWMHGMSG